MKSTHNKTQEKQTPWPQPHSKLIKKLESSMKALLKILQSRQKDHTPEGIYEHLAVRQKEWVAPKKQKTTVLGSSEKKIKTQQLVSKMAPIGPQKHLASSGSPSKKRAKSSGSTCCCCKALRFLSFPSEVFFTNTSIATTIATTTTTTITTTPTAATAAAIIITTRLQHKWDFYLTQFFAFWLSFYFAGCPFRVPKRSWEI